MLMIRPLPSATMCVSVSCVRTNAPPRFTSITRHHSAGGASQAGPMGPLMPALLIRMSAVPSLSRSSLTATAAACVSVMSAQAATAVPPARLISLTAAARSGEDRAISPTAAPARASRVLSSLPTPRLPPLTRATIPSSGRWPAASPGADAKVVVPDSAVTAVASAGRLAGQPGVLFDQQPAEDLARRGPGDVVGELDLAHPFVTSHALANPRHQFVRRSRSSQHDECLG